jgi:hypothetical protein
LGKKVSLRTTSQRSWDVVKKLVIGGVYRQWSSETTMSTPSLNHVQVQRKCGPAMEREQLENIVEQIKSATEATRAVVILGDFNLDAHRLKDESYSRLIFMVICIFNCILIF